jgi:WD40 repeat protein
MSDNIFISGSSDNTIKVWDLKTKTCIRTIENNGKIYTILKITNEKFISGDSNKNIKIWSLKQESCIEILEGHSDCVRSLCMINYDTIASGSIDETIKIWKI